MKVKSQYNEKSGILTITCDKKDVILAFGSEDNYKRFMEKLEDEIWSSLGGKE